MLKIAVVRLLVQVLATVYAFTQSESALIDPLRNRPVRAAPEAAPTAT